MKTPRKTMANSKTYNIYNEERETKVRLDLNENAWGCSPKVLQTIRHVSVIDISLYPAYDALINKLAQFHQIRQQDIIISNGADDSIRCVFDCFVEAGDEILLPVPNYGMFDIFSKIRGSTTIEVLYNEDFSFPAQKLLDLVSEKVKLIIIVNPANPLGTVIAEQELLEILKTAKDSIVLLDETYFHFTEKTYVPLIESFDNLIIVQTFSKAYGLTGLRLGMLFSAVQNIQNLAKVNLPFAVNNLALKAGFVALDDQDFIKQVIKNVTIETEFLKKELQKMDIETHDCNTNFLLINMGERADEVHQQLQSRGILLRNLNKYPLLQGYLRISIGRREDNLKLLEALHQLISSI